MNEHQKKALDAVVVVFNEARMDHQVTTPKAATADDFYVVWFAKTLQNWKALISTDLLSGLYFEVTYNGDRCESYIDWYDKRQNTVVSDFYLADVKTGIHLTD